MISVKFCPILLPESVNKTIKFPSVARPGMSGSVQLSFYAGSAAQKLLERYGEIMNIQQENQRKQREEALQGQLKMQELLAPVRVQNEYNKQNLETQHKYNLEIFEKQAELAREINAKQSKLTKVLIICTILAAIIGSAIGVLLPNFIKSILPQNEQQNQLIKESSLHQQKSVVVQSRPDQKIKTQQSAQEESSSKGSLKKP